MLLKTWSTLRRSATTRALASLILSTSIEITARRDTSHSEIDKAVLKSLFRAYSAFTYSWSKIIPECTPEDYIAEWDRKISNSSFFDTLLLKSRVSCSKTLIMTDIEDLILIPFSGNLLKVNAASSALESITTREKILSSI
jgi:hypothetical protein